MKKPKKHVPRDRDPAQVPGSSDAGIAPTWPDHDYREDSSALNDVSDEGNAGQKSKEPGGDL